MHLLWNLYFVIQAGFLPNVFSALAYHPKEFECFFQYYDVLMEENTGESSSTFLL